MSRFAAALGLCAIFSGCAGLDKAFIAESSRAAFSAAGDYLSGCTVLTVAPAFTVDWTAGGGDAVGYAGGLFVGCPDGRLVEFTCGDDPAQPEAGLVCQLLRGWQAVAEKP